MQLKPLNEQVIVLTGASSGIGLVTARMAARHGARLVLASRSGDALNQLADELASVSPERPLVVPTDVGDESAVGRLADEAVRHFGRFDTWINDAGVSIYGKLEVIPTADHRRLFETNFWGVVYGSLAAARHLRLQHGGAIINVGSVVSDAVIPYQGMYSASKHAVKGFTDALRMELEADRAPISVTLIKPTGINTPYVQHAKNYLEREDTLPPPVYAPESVARAILHAATHRIRDVYIGSGAKAIASSARFAPRLYDKTMELLGRRMQVKNEPPRPRPQNSLHQPSEHSPSVLQERGEPDRFTREHSLYTASTLHPVRTSALVLAGAALAATALLSARSRS